MDSEITIGTRVRIEGILYDYDNYRLNDRLAEVVAMKSVNLFAIRLLRPFDNYDKKIFFLTKDYLKTDLNLLVILIGSEFFI